MSNEPALLTAGDSDADDLPPGLEPGRRGRPGTGRPSTGRPSTGRPSTGRPSTGRQRGFIVSVALLSALIGVIVFLVVVFQPFADAAGGCGGG
jgi:hypothetical protein